VAMTLGRALFIGEKVRRRMLGVYTDSIPSFSFVTMKFVRISKWGLPDVA
jgi:hypothetical protein